MSGWAYLASVVGKESTPKVEESPAIAMSEEPSGPNFAVDWDTIDSRIYGYTTEDYIAPAQDITRAEAIQVPAVKRSRDLIAGTIGGLPLYRQSVDFERDTIPLLEQPERARPRTITMIDTVEDMLFEGRSYWRVTERDHKGYPSKIKRMVPGSVVPRENTIYYKRSDGSSLGYVLEEIPDAELIVIYSPNDPLLKAGARAIRTALRLDGAASRYADEPMPTGYFAPTEGHDPADDDDVSDLLTAWKSARQTRSTAYVPAAVQYNPVQWSPADLQLADARQHAVLEIARCVGIDPEDLGVSTTSRTYQNGVDRRRALLDFTLAAYMQAIQDRLSMGDVTQRGYTVRFDTTGFLRSNEKERMETYILAKQAGAYDADEVQRREELPNREIEQPQAEVRPLRSVPDQQGERVAASAGDNLKFDADDNTFGFETDEGRLGFEVDRESRTIYGLAVPFGVVARKGGRRFMFSAGTIRLPKDPSRIKLLVAHDRSQAVGKAIELTEDETGLWAKFKVGRGADGDRVLAKAEDGVWDGLSVGFDNDSRFDNRGGVMNSVDAPLAEISITPNPAFSDARVSAVAAEADDSKGTPMPETGTDSNAPDTGPAFDMDALVAALGEKFTITPKAPEGDGPEVIPVDLGGERFQVEEPGPYNFNADRGGFVSGGKFSFGTDLRAGVVAGDVKARERVFQFMAEQEELIFADVDTTDGAALNPSTQRPDLYVDQKQYQYPLWAAVRKESLSDLTPKVLPKWSSHSGLVAAHTEATEPAPGAFAATTQTITPAGVSGKVEITRELMDQGGNPRIDNLIWNKMLAGWFEALEAKVVAVLDAASPTGITITTAAEDSDISSELATAFAALQFIRGGFSFDTFAAQIDLYKELAEATDDVGRPLFPMIGPSNANGTSAPRFASMNVHGVPTFGSWALAATGSVAASSYLFDRADVYGAASAPERIDWNFGATVQTANIPQLSHVTLGIWGYSVVAITDLTGVREVIYDPAA